MSNEILSSTYRQKKFAAVDGETVATGIIGWLVMDMDTQLKQRERAIERSIANITRIVSRHPHHGLIPKHFDLSSSEFQDAPAVRYKRELVE